MAHPQRVADGEEVPPGYVLPSEECLDWATDEMSALLREKRAQKKRQVEEHKAAQAHTAKYSAHPAQYKGQSGARIISRMSRAAVFGIQSDSWRNSFPDPDLSTCVIVFHTAALTTILSKVVSIKYYVCRSLAYRSTAGNSFS